MSAYLLFCEQCKQTFNFANLLVLSYFFKKYQYIPSAFKVLNLRTKHTISSFTQLTLAMLPKSTTLNADSTNANMLLPLLTKFSVTQ